MQKVNIIPPYFLLIFYFYTISLDIERKVRYFLLTATLKTKGTQAMTDEELYEALCDEADTPHDSDLVDVIITLGYYPSINTK